MVHNTDVSASVDTYGSTLITKGASTALSDSEGSEPASASGAFYKPGLKIN